MGCDCVTRTYRNPPVKKPGNCLCVNDLRVGCDNGPSPCGGVDGTFTVDLKEYNNVTASPCSVVYKLLKYDKQAFTSVTITSDGVLTAVTSTDFKPHVERLIEYKVDSPCSLLSDRATVYICFKDVCKFVDCEGVCNPCTADCFGTLPGSNSVNSTCGGIGTFDVSALTTVTYCNGSVGYSITSKADEITTATINSSGLLSYGLPSPIAPGTYPVHVGVTCSDFTNKLDILVNIVIPDLCVGVVVGPNEFCDKCTGDVNDKEGNLSINKTGVGSKAPGGLGFINN